MDAPEEEPAYEYLKAGHPPATKISGGVRVVQHKNPPTEHHHEVKQPAEEEELTEEERSLAKKEEKHHQQALVSGVPMSLAKAYPKEAVKAFHEKPIPKHYQQESGPPKTIPGLFQPRQQYFQNYPAENLPTFTGNKDR